MTSLTEKFDDLETMLAGQSATMGAYVDTVETKLQTIADFLDIMNENNAANTKALLAALGQTGACFPCPTPSIVVPPIATNPLVPNTAQCKRAQGIIDTIHKILAGMDTLQSFNVIGSFNVINDAISEIVGAIAAGDALPLPSFPETVNIVGDYVSYAGERLFSGVGLIEQFSPLESALITAVANGTTPEAAQAAYVGVIEASGVSNGARLLFEAVAYNALWSYYFDPDSDPDLSAFDGDVCGFAECVTIEAQVVNFDGFPGHTAIVWSPTFTAVSVTPGGYHADNDAWCTEDLSGWTITSTFPVTLREQYTSSTIDLAAGVPYTLIDVDGMSVLNLTGSDAFSVELCPPT